MKNCTNCNAEIEDDATFCSDCGEKIYEVIFCPECGTQTTTEFVFCDNCSTRLIETKEEIKNKTKNKKSRFNIFKVGLSILIIGFLILCVVGVKFALNIFDNSTSKNNNILYLKEKQVYYTKFPKIKPEQLTTKFNYFFINPSNKTYAHIFFYSKDDRYLFYPDNNNSNIGYGYYCRDLKSKFNNENAVFKIDDEILDVKLTDTNDKLFYTKGNDGRFHVFDVKNKKSEKLDVDVKDFHISKDGDYIIYNKKDGSIYEMTIGKDNKKNKIDSDLFLNKILPETLSVVYKKSDGLYLKERGKDKVKIDSNISTLVSVINEKQIYYTKEDTYKIKLSKFLNDDKAKKDLTMTRPIYPSQYEYQIKTWEPNNSYTEWNEEKQEYGRWKNELDKPKYEEAQKKYEELRQEYNKKLKRDELRQILNEKEDPVRNTILYFFNGDDSIKISENVLNITTTTETKPIVVYSKNNFDDTKKFNLSEISSEYNLLDKLKDNIESYIAVSETSNKFEHENGKGFNINPTDGAVYYLDKHDETNNYGTLMKIATNESISKAIKIDDDVTRFRFGNKSDKIFYYKNVEKDSGELYFEGKKIASNVYLNFLYNFKETSNLLYFTDYSIHGNYGTLEMFENNNTIKISEDVGQFAIKSENKIFYLANYSNSSKKGDAFLFNDNKKPIQIDTDVTHLVWDENLIDDFFDYKILKVIN